MPSEPYNFVVVDEAASIPWHVWFGGWKNVLPSIRRREDRLLARFNTARRIKRRAELARRGRGR